MNRPVPTEITVVLPQVKQTSGAIRFALPNEERATVPVSDLYVRKDFVRDRTRGLPIAVKVTVEPIYRDDTAGQSNQGGRA
jgi:hypothetical protein